MWAHNTLDVAEVECSVAYLNEARERSDLEIIKDPRPMPLDAEGNLPNRVWASVVRQLARNLRARRLICRSTLDRRGISIGRDSGTVSMTGCPAS